MKLAQWVACSGGTAKISKKLGINQHRLRRFMRREHTPPPGIFRQILLFSDGKVTPLELLKKN